MTDITAWLADRGLAKYAPRFVDEEIDLDALGLLDDDDLIALGLPLGPRRKLLRAVAEIGGARAGGIEDTSSEPAAPVSAPSSPGDLARRALMSQHAAEGERKLITILFADLRGSSSLIDGLDAEASVDRLRPAVEAMTQAVQRFDGTVNRVQGDGIMALFGAPIAHEDHPLRASMAGLAMRDAIRSGAGDALIPRVGIHSGEVVVRTIHNDLTIEYEADGPAVHLAARMEQMAEPGTVRATGDVWRSVEGHVDGRALGASEVRGYSVPVVQYELTAVSSAASRWEGRARRGLSRFVGRARELAVIQQAAVDAMAGNGRVVGLIGEAGMGKSRLLHEFLAGPGMRGWTLRVAAASPHGKRTPYLPLKRLLRAIFEIEPDHSREAVSARVTGYLKELGEGLDSLRSPLLAVLDQDPGDSAWDELDPKSRRRRIVDAIHELALARARAGPLLFAMEDLHWIDEETEEVLNRLVDSAGGASMLIVTTSRPEYRGMFYGKTYFVPVHVGAIPAAGVQELLSGLLGTDSSLDTLKAEIEALSEGRPLHVEETVRELVDRGVLIGKPAERTLAKPDAKVPIPDSMNGVIGARIDQLESGHKRLLQIAAVVGRTVPLELLSAVAGLPDEELRLGVAALQSAEFLFEVQSFPAPEYLFKHALIESVAYESLLRRQRAKIHEAVLLFLESRHTGRIDEHVELLAHHAYHAGLWTKAVCHYRSAGAKAIAASAHREAAEHLDQALAALANLPESEERKALGIDIRRELRPALGAIAAYEPLLTRLEEAQALAQSLGDESGRVRLAADSIHTLYHLGRIASAIETGDEAIRVTRVLDDPRALMLASANTAQAHYYAGDLRRALEISLPLADSIRSQFRHERIGTTGTSSCIWLGNLCGVLAALGEFDRAIEFGEEACRIATETGHPFDDVMASNWLAWCLALRGESDAVVEIGERNTETVATNELSFLESWTTVIHAQGLAATGEFDRALARIEAFHERGSYVPALVTMATWQSTMEAATRYECGDRDGAVSLCERILERVDRYELRLCSPSALRTLGQYKAEACALEPAFDLLERARSAAQSQGARPEVAHAQLALARWHFAQGDTVSARFSAESACNAYDTMGMCRWSSEARALLDV